MKKMLFGVLILFISCSGGGAGEAQDKVQTDLFAGGNFAANYVLRDASCPELTPSETLEIQQDDNDVLLIYEDGSYSSGEVSVIDGEDGFEFSSAGFDCAGQFIVDEYDLETAQDYFPGVAIEQGDLVIGCDDGYEVCVMSFQ